jgi:(E)-4-hydroxy-3-methylbut-2-enyl-diphosphate synthase
VYVDGKLKCTLRGDHIVEEFIAMLNAYVERRYAKVLETVDA